METMTIEPRLAPLSTRASERAVVLACATGTGVSDVRTCATGTGVTDEVRLRATAASTAGMGRTGFAAGIVPGPRTWSPPT